MNDINIESLSKRIGKLTVLHNINCNLVGGNITGLIGNNGAGKTTLMKCLASFYTDYTGAIKIDNTILTNKEISYIPDNPVFYEELTVGEHIEFISAINNTKELANYYIDLFDVKKYLHKFPHELSKGTLQRMMIILAFLRRKKVLIADEPFDGLDPSQVKVLKDELKKLRNDGMTIVLSSHQLSLVQEICNSFIFMKDGEIIYTVENKSESDHVQMLYDDLLGG